MGCKLDRKRKFAIIKTKRDSDSGVSVLPLLFVIDERLTLTSNVGLLLFCKQTYLRLDIMVATSKPNVNIICNASATVMLPPPYGGTDLSESLVLL